MKKILVLGGIGAMAGETTMDLVRTSDFDEIMVADIDIAKAEKVTKALGDARLQVVKINAESVDETAKLMSAYDVVANGLPRTYCENAIKAAIIAKVDMLDLVSPHEETLVLDPEAQAAEISVVGGVGITPGITNILAKLGADRLESVEQIDIDFAAFRSIAHSPGRLPICYQSSADGNVGWTAGVFKKCRYPSFYRCTDAGGRQSHEKRIRWC